MTSPGISRRPSIPEAPIAPDARGIPDTANHTMLEAHSTIDLRRLLCFKCAARPQNGRTNYSENYTEHYENYIKLYTIPNSDCEYLICSRPKYTTKST